MKDAFALFACLVGASLLQVTMAQRGACTTEGNARARAMAEMQNVVTGFRATMAASATLRVDFRAMIASLPCDLTAAEWTSDQLNQLDQAFTDASDAAPLDAVESDVQQLVMKYGTCAGCCCGLAKATPCFPSRQSPTMILARKSRTPFFPHSTHLKPCVGHSFSAHGAASWGFNV